MKEPPLCAAPLPTTKTPRNTVPPGACDCHFHVFGPPSVQVPQRGYTAPPASFKAYLGMRQTLGLQRSVIVQPSVYGADNRTTLEAAAADGTMRAVVVLDAEATLSDLRAFQQYGAVGARANLLFPSDVDFDHLQAQAMLMAAVGWHLQVLVDVSSLPDLVKFVADLPVPVVFDHMGHVPADRGLQDPGFQTLVSLLDRSDVWVKLSGAYRVAPQDMSAARDMARALIAANPDRLVWGTDWPHPAVAGPMPDDGDLLDLLYDWAGTETVRHILVQNPEGLYGFDAWTGNDGI